MLTICAAKFKKALIQASILNEFKHFSLKIRLGKMSNEVESNMEIEADQNSGDDEIQLVDSQEANMIKSTPSTPSCDQKLNSFLTNSAEKLDKNLKLQIKLENAKKRQEEKVAKRNLKKILLKKFHFRKEKREKKKSEKRPG